MIVRDALSAYRAAHGLRAEAYDAARFVVELGPVTLVFPNPGYLRVHDIHHVALGLPPTFWGEVQISAFELRSGVPSALIAVLCVGALVFGFLLSPRRVLAALRLYRGTSNLYADPRPLEALHALELDAVRLAMNVRGDARARVRARGAWRMCRHTVTRSGSHRRPRV